MTDNQRLMDALISNEHLVSLWDFQEEGGSPRVAKGRCEYALQEMAGPVHRTEEGVLGQYSADIVHGQWFSIPRSLCPELNFHSDRSQLTVAAWVKWELQEHRGCKAIAGMWDETRSKRQYCLFIDLKIWDSAEQVCGHVSSVGGPTPGYEYCMTTAIGSTPISKGEWHFIAFTYDGQYASCYLDGKLDTRAHWNPYLYDEGGLFDGGTDGADFTVAGVDRSSEPGNFYSGLLGGLAVFDRALSGAEIAQLSELSVLPAAR
ncbi:LamG domain-containing protein [Paenibacillus sp. strain BS8-2]